MESDRSRPGALTPEDASASLDLVDQARADLADRLASPRWYHPILGLIEAALVASLGVPSPWRLVLLVLALVGLAALVRAYTRLTGLGVGGDYVRLAGGWVVALLGLILAAIAAVLLLDQVWVTVTAAVGVFVATIVLGRRAEETVRARLRVGIRVGR
jgi:hypothetical protein